MYPFLLTLHSLLRWLVLCSLISAIYFALQGWIKGGAFTAGAGRLRYWAVTLLHLQLVLGMTIYFQSPVVRYSVTGIAFINEHSFFKYIHIGMMMVAVVVITIGSARAKRMMDDTAKYKSMFIWFLVGLMIILIAIPWPFSPLAQRPYLRAF
jgi:hypothetical protein